MNSITTHTYTMNRKVRSITGSTVRERTVRRVRLQSEENRDVNVRQPFSVSTDNPFIHSFFTSECVLLSSSGRDAAFTGKSRHIKDDGKSKNKNKSRVKVKEKDKDGQRQEQK